MTRPRSRRSTPGSKGATPASDKINSTPTFVINGKGMEPGYHTLDEMDAAIKAAGG